MPSPKSVLLASWSGQFAGVEIRMLQEAAYLQKNGWRVTVATCQFDGRDELQQRLDAMGIKLYLFEPPPFLSDWRWRWWHRLRAQFARPSWLNRNRFDLVHVFMPWTHRGVELMWMAARAGLPVVVSAHNAFSMPADTPWHRRHMKQAMKTVRGAYGVSGSALALFRRGFSPYLPNTVRWQVLYNAVDTERFSPSTHSRQNLIERLGLAPDSLIIGSVGRLSRHKRPAYVIEVFSIIRQALPATQLLMVGAGALRAEAEAAVQEYDLVGAVHLMGFQKKPESIMSGLDLHLLLSSVEGFGLVTAEAMACAVPVIATEVPGSEELIVNGQTGYLVPKDDPQIAASRAIEILSDTELAHKMGQAGRARAEAEYSQAVWEAGVKAFYSAVIGAEA